MLARDHALSGALVFTTVSPPLQRRQITTGRFAETWIVSTLLLAGLGYLLYRDSRGHDLSALHRPDRAVTSRLRR